MLSIKQRQMNLKFLGLYLGNIDNNEGPLTKKAYREFQKFYNLKIDGDYGTLTNAKLIEVIKIIQRNLKVEQDGVAGPITNNVKKSMKWENIKYFKPSEFTCKCGCGTNNIDMQLVKILDEIREDLKVSINISSGYRCEKHNKNVGGDYNSRHILGKAADIIANGIEKEKVLKKCKEYVVNGKARYCYTNNTNMKNAVHIDIL